MLIYKITDFFKKILNEHKGNTVDGKKNNVEELQGRWAFNKSEI